MKAVKSVLSGVAAEKVKDKIQKKVNAASAFGVIRVTCNKRTCC
jgi:hypothetical protein